MLKRFTLSLFVISISICAFAQSPIGEGGKQLNLGVGLFDSGVPIYAGMDFGVHPDITVGGQVGLDLGFDYFSISGRGDYHFNTLLEIPRDWDFYAGLSIGFLGGIENDYDSGFDLGLQVGGRYYWNSDWGINLEFGGGNNLSGGRFGVSKRF
ncbi:MAG: outer membrane immunogenic protein [Cryomorphaceae bacterium]|jgi:outer membrane immunogenic protein